MIVGAKQVSDKELVADLLVVVQAAIKNGSPEALALAEEACLLVRPFVAIELLPNTRRSPSPFNNR